MDGKRARSGSPNGTYRIAIRPVSQHTVNQGDTRATTTAARKAALGPPAEPARGQKPWIIN